MLQYNPTVSGSLSVTGNISATQGITGSFSGSIAGFPTDTLAFSSSLSTRITNTELTSSEYVSTSGSLSIRVTAAETTSSAYVTASGSLAGRITSNEARTGSFATTGSNQFNGSQTITGSLTATGTIVAQTLVVQTITSSVEFVTGSNRFGSTTGNTHEFTGSLLVSGSVGSVGAFTSTGTSTSTLGFITTNTSANKTHRAYTDSSGNYIIYDATSDSNRLTIASGGAATFASSVTATIFDSTSNAFRFNGSNALSLVTLGGQNVVKINAAGYWGTQLVGANDQGILIDNTGKVGIGLTNPSTNSKLHVYRGGGSYDTIVADGDVGTNTGFGIYEGGSAKYALYSNGAGGNDSFNIYNFGASANSLTILTSGYVGIGTTNPSEKLHLAGPANNIFLNEATSGNYAINRLKNSSYTVDVGVDSSGLYLDGSGGSTRFYAGSTQTFRIASNSDVYMTNNAALFFGASALTYIGAGNTSMTLAVNNATALSFNSSRAATFTNNVTVNGNIISSLSYTSESSVSGVGTSFTNSGISFGNATGVWLVSISSSGDGNMYSAALYVVTTGAYSKTISLIGGPSNHFGNGTIIAQLSTTDGVSADLQVRRSSAGSSSVNVKILKIGQQ